MDHTTIVIWFTPDPAEQFANPYLAMGNNPVMYVDPNGEWIDIAAAIVFQGVVGGQTAKENGGNFWAGFAQGALSAGVGLGLGYMNMPPSMTTFANGTANLATATFINGISPGTVDIPQLTQNLAFSTALTGFSTLGTKYSSSNSYRDIQTYGLDENGNFQVINHRVHNRTWSTTLNYNLKGWTNAGLAYGYNMQLNNYRAIINISQYSNPSYSINNHGQFSINNSQSLSISALEYSDARNMPRADFNLNAELNVDGHNNPVARKSLKMGRETIHGGSYNWEYAGETTFSLPTNGVAQVRLEGAWSHNVGGSAVTPISSGGNPFKSMINDLITIPKIY